ncbi:MAG: hypothetical protein ACRDRK_19175 [Pseudonocardia sp.]
MTARPPSADLLLARAAPTSSDLALAASAFLRPTARKALLVHGALVQALPFAPVPSYPSGS